MIRAALYMTAASVLYAFMGVFVYQIKVWDPSSSPVTASFIRVLINLIILLGLASRDGVVVGVKKLFGDMSFSLWLRGIFGSVSLIGTFVSIHYIGIGEASFLQAVNVFWIGLLSPIILKQPNSRLGWLAILGGLVGLYFLYQPDFSSDQFIGRTIGLISGFSAGIAYVLIAKAGKTNSSLTVVFYLCFVAFWVQLFWFLWKGFTWPVDFRSWMMLLGAGLTASAAQICMTESYRMGPAAIMGAVSYLTPVFNLTLGYLLFATIPNDRGLFGAFLVVLSGVVLPFAQIKKRT